VTVREALEPTGTHPKSTADVEREATGPNRCRLTRTAAVWARGAAGGTGSGIATVTAGAIGEGGGAALGAFGGSVVWRPPAGGATWRAVMGDAGGITRDAGDGCGVRRSR
jgi:hypothetical protein